ncbi:MAG TPA: hypothetical protein VJV79_14135 [Polyangiaceae bacterium]|nr:hypothetical protein [Polyangiaceae bacterium]
MRDSFAINGGLHEQTSFSHSGVRAFRGDCGGLLVRARGESGRGSIERLINVNEFLYFRCNSTAWGVDDSTRLKGTSNPSVVSLTFR